MGIIADSIFQIMWTCISYLEMNAKTKVWGIKQQKKWIVIQASIEPPVVSLIKTILTFEPAN